MGRASARRRADRHAQPLIVAHADCLLDRGGAMVRAVEAIGRGAETDWGAPFELDLTAEGDGRR